MKAHAAWVALRKFDREDKRKYTQEEVRARYDALVLAVQEAERLATNPSPAPIKD